MNAVTGVGAPWYTSGVQKWNGTAATLNPRPTSSSATPARIERVVALERAPSLSNAATISVMFVDPVAP